MAQSPIDIEGHWAQTEIDTLLEKGVVRGYEDGSFRPDAPITRAEFVALLNRAAGIQPSGVSNSFTDVDSRDWFAGDAGLAAAIGTITGFEDGTFRPANPITRQEVAVILARALGLDSVEHPAFSDAKTIAPWAESAVAAVASAGFMKGYPDGTFGAVRSVTRAEAATLIQRAQARIVTAMARPVEVFAVDQQGQPLNSGVLRVHRKGERSFVAATQGEKSTFYLKPGEYEFTVVAKGLAGHTAEKVIPGVTSVRVTAEAAATLSGIVIDEDQQPVAGAVVALTTNPTFLAVTEPDGTFTASVLPEREYSATVAFFTQGEGGFDPDLSRPDPALTLMDNPNAPLPDGVRRPQVSRILTSFTAPKAGNRLALGLLDASNGRLLEPIATTPQPVPPPTTTPPGGGPGGGYQPPSLERISITPANGTVELDQEVTIAVTGHFSDGSSSNLTRETTLTSSDSTVATIAAGKAKGLAEGTVTVTASVRGIVATTSLQVVSLAGPPVAQTAVVDMADRTEFLYTGDSPLQKDVEPQTIEEDRVAVLRGRVTTRDGAPLSGVKVNILDHPEFGYTLSRVDGMFDLAVNGGEQLTVQYFKEAYFLAQRDVVVPWQDFVVMADVALVQADPKVTTVDLESATEIQVAQGTQVTDDDGTRTATVMFQPGTTAQMVLPDGSVKDLPTLSVRATEYTVGTGGPAAMPGELPPTTAYTYAVELSVDEAMAEGATEVRFSKPLPFYVENYLDFPVGTPVPTGYYDREKGEWVPSANGRIIEIVSETNGMADLNIDKDDAVDDSAELAALGIDDAERSRLAELYGPGQQLWRVPIPHFTPWDHNWPYGPPKNSPAPSPAPTPQKPPSQKCIKGGSIIECQGQVLGEAIPVVGTPYRLHYQSDRTPGGNVPSYTLEFPLIGKTVPEDLLGIGVTIQVAGRQFSADYPAEPNQRHSFTWDGKDAYGRRVLGAQPVRVTVAYTYRAQYYESGDDLVASFGQFSSNVATAGSRASLKVARLGHWTGMIGAWDAQAFGLGGWSLSSLHAYDTVGKTLYLGDGSRRYLSDLEMLVDVAGTGQPAGTGSVEGGDPLKTAISGPSHLAMAADGTLYFVEATAHRIRKIGTDGKIYTVAGTGEAGVTPDGELPAEAPLSSPQGLAIGTDGSLYFAEGGSHRIRRIYQRDGKRYIETVAGTGEAGFSGDGGPATGAKLDGPTGIAMGPDGSLYLIDRGNQRVRRVGPDGVIATVAGGAPPDVLNRGDYGPAAQAWLSEPYAVAVSPDGTLYIVDRSDRRVRRVTQDGIITTFAGRDMFSFEPDDGKQAIDVSLVSPVGVAIGPDGSVYIAEEFGARVRRVTPDGVITTAAGSYTGLEGTAGSLPTTVKLNRPQGLLVSPEGMLYMSETQGNRIRKIGTGRAWNAEGIITIPADDGSEIYVFDRTGRHLRTLHGLTGQVILTFEYNEAGHVTALIDGDGNRTEIMRESTTGRPLRIVAPGGQATALTLNTNGYLTSMSNPAKETVRMSYDDGGLLRTFQSAAGGIWRFTYDDKGRLVRDQDPLGGYTALARKVIEYGYEVIVTTAEGQVTTYRVEELPNGDQRRTRVEPSGAETVLLSRRDGTNTLTTPDGAETTWVDGPDPRWGMLVPLVTSMTTKSPDGIVSTATRERTAEVDSGDPTKLTSMSETITDNGYVTTVTYAYDSEAKRWSIATETPEGRRSRSYLDGQGRMVEQQQDIDAGIDPVTRFFTKGYLTSITQGAYEVTFTYDKKGRMIGRTDALGNTTTYEYDDADRLVKTTMPDDQVYIFQYNKDGLLAKVILPDGMVYTQDYSAARTETAFAFPGAGSLRAEYDLDKVQRRVILPDGRVRENSYDAGRIKRTAYAEGSTVYTYSDQTDRPEQILQDPVIGTSQAITFDYDSTLVTAMTWTGAAEGAYTYTYNSRFLLGSITLDGETTSLTWDNDGLLTGFGPFQIQRGGPEGATTKITDNALTVDYTYDLDVADSEPPTWPEGAALSATQVRSYQITLEWSHHAEDNVGVRQYRIMGGSEPILAGPNTRTYTVTGLTPETTYTFSLVAVDEKGNQTQTALTVTATTTQDTAPTWPSGSNLTGTPTPYTVTLNWPAAEDDASVTAYRVLRGGTQVGDELAHSTRTFAVTGLQELTAYTFSVQAKDAKGQWSPELTTNVSTLEDMPPQWVAPAALTYSNVAGTRLTLTWSQAQDDVGTHRYHIYRNAETEPYAMALGNANSAEVSALTPNTSYTFKVEVCDVKGQCTSNGPSVTVKTASVAGLGGEPMVERVSETSQGQSANDLSEAPAISADGNLVAFYTFATNLSDQVMAKQRHVFVYDRNLDSLRLVSVDNDGNPLAGHHGMTGLDISADGRYVVYTTATSDYGSGNGYATSGLKVIDLSATLPIYGEKAVVDLVEKQEVEAPSISETGRFVAYTAYYRSNQTYQSFVLDRDSDNDGTFDEEGATATVSLPVGSKWPRVSGNGDWVVFEMPGANDKTQIYVKDLRADAEPVVVSLAADGALGQSDSYRPDLSADGRFVLFRTWAWNIVDLNWDALVVRDRDTDADGIFDEPGQVSITRVDVSENGVGGNNENLGGRISPDGRFVVFASKGTNLVPNDTNGLRDVFVRDLLGNRTVRLHTDSLLNQANDEAHNIDIPDLSDDGTVVAFTSLATNLVPNDNNGASDIFVASLVATAEPAWSGGSLTASNVEDHSLTVHWNHASDNVAVKYYHIYQNGQLLDSVAGSVTSLAVDGLSPESTYTFRVEAEDPSGNLSSEDLTLTVTTLADTYLPELQSAKFNGVKLRLTYSEPLKPDSVPTPADFTVRVNGSGRPVSGVALDESAVILTTVEPLAEEDEVTLDYTAGSAPLQDPVGNRAPNLTNRLVTYGDITPPTLVSIAFKYTGRAVILTYSEPLQPADTLPVRDFQLMLAGLRQEIIGVSVSEDQVTLDLPTVIGEGSYTLTYTGETIRDLSGNRAERFEAQPVSEPPSQTLTPAAKSTQLAENPGSGRLESRLHTVVDKEFYQINLFYDAMGRIVAKEERVGEKTTRYEYTFDKNGQLLRVTRDGALEEEYKYDDNGNRTSRKIGTGPEEVAGFDTQGRISTLGTVSYTFDGAGFLSKRGADSFTYSTRGELLQATVGTKSITYTYDGLGRRVARTDSTGTYQYLYGNPMDPMQVTHARDPQGLLTAFYYDEAGLLYAMKRGENWYYVGADQVGTPKVVTDAVGNVVKTLAYDSFGRLLGDSNPAFDLPIGYAGGLADPDTKLIRFGYRDYDPEAGRWTARDPLLFQGGQTNLYVYVGNNPVGYRDPLGLFCIGANAYGGFGGGIKLCVDDDGLSVCGEIGVGIGGGVEADPFGSIDKNGGKVKAEGKCQLGPAGIGGGIQSGECGPEGQIKTCVGPACMAVNGSGDVTVTAENYKFDVGCDAKLAWEQCGQARW